MKNFTKQFANKALFKPTRWLLVALMFLLGTASAWATLYVAGSMNSWNTTANAMSGSTTVSATFTLAAGTYEYRIVENGNNWHWVKTSTSSSSGVSSISNYTSVTSSNVSFTLASSTANYTCTIYYNTSTNTTYVKAVLPTYTITYNANGGSGAPGNQTKTHGTNLTLSTTEPTRTGYTFDSWNTAANGTGTKYESGASYTTNAAATLYAQWKANSYTITYKDQGNVAFSGTHASGYPTTHTYGTATTLKSATKSGYNFLGWFTTSACDGTKVTSLGATAYTADITLYAKWEKACDDVVAPTLSIERDITDNCGTITKGIIAITNYAQFSNCTFTLNGNAVTPTNAGKIEGVTASGSCKVVVTNNCGNSSEPVSIDMPKTTVKAPTVYDVSLTYPQVSFATNNGSVNINLSQSERDVTYYLYKNGTKVTGSDKQGDGRALVWSVLESGTYTVKAANPCNGGVIDMKGSVEFTCMSNLILAFEGGKSTFCPGETANINVTFNGTGKGDENTNPGKYGWQWTTDNINYTSVYLTKSDVKVPVTIKGDGSISLSVRSCNGTVNSNTLKFTVTPAPEIGVKVVQDIVKCGNDITQYGEIQITGYNPAYTYKIGNDVVEPNNEGIIDNLSSAGTFTLSAINSCNAQTPVQFTISSTDNKPYISGATFTQPGKENAIELTVPTGNDTKWTVNNNGDLSTATGSSTMFSAENKNTYTITADNKGCTDTHVVTVSDAFYIWVRNAKENETAYSNFYHADQNSPEYRGGVMFYAECTELPTNNTYTTYNEGGREADLVQNDCDGYTWYGFRASADVISGTKYFYVHAKNNINTGGWYTHTVPTKVTLTSDVYYTLCEISVNDCNEGSKGWKIVSTSAPYAGPVVHASGNDFSFNKNNFADFVALYVTDCSGKEIDFYQWQYSETENGTYNNYSSVCTYVGKKTEPGDAGKTNNIRPNVAGWYRCTATYKDGSSVTSTAKQVTDNDTKDVANYATFTSDLPIIMVNTNGYGFPSCDGLSGTASKNADVIKAKISVDVKIKLGNDIVYDRKARMNYRGSSSLNFVKKSYAFCPGKADCVEDKGRVDYVKTEKLNMLNVGSAVDKDWVLYAAAADPSIMRNRLVFDTFRDMTGSWSVQSRYVELIVDGEYKGIYVFMDKITNNANRVNITDENGFILKFDKTDIVDRYEGSGDKKTFKSLYSGKDGSGTYDTQIDQRFEIEYPEMEDVEEEEAGKWATTVNNIKSMINNFETQLKAGNYAEVQKIIDYKSWADWFIITEYAKNMDAYRASCLFVYNGDKLEARPLWDQELSFKNYCATLCDDYSCDNEKGLLIRTSKIYNDTESCSAPFWFTGKYVSGRGTEAIGGSQQFAGYLLNDPCFVQTVKDRWNDHKGKALSTDSLNAKLARYTNEMATALDREKSMWKSEGGKLSRETCQCSYSGTTGYSDIKISDSKGDITEWISARPAELDKALLDEVGTGLSISFSEENINTTPWEPVILQVHNESGYDYVLTYTDNALDQLTGVIIEKNGDTYKYNIPRPANWGTGDEATEGERANIVYGLKATLQMDSSNVVCGSQAEVPFDEATITLQDEPNEDCVQP